jgi:hypothetical protein
MGGQWLYTRRVSSWFILALRLSPQVATSCPGCACAESVLEPKFKTKPKANSVLAVSRISDWALVCINILYQNEVALTMTVSVARAQG